MKTVLAIPTIKERGDTWKATGELWGRVTVFPSWRPGGWAAGLNEAWEEHGDADIFICGSDDIWPEGDWLPVVKHFLDRNQSPVPLMKDPRFTIQGGVITDEERENGTESHMTNFPVLKQEWLNDVFPLPEDLHYYSDNLIADRLHAIGVPTVFAKDFVVIHDWDERGRGAGMGSEEARMEHDRDIYRALKRDRVNR